METRPQNPQPRTRAVLVAELKRVAKKGSTAFWAFWDGMTQEEKQALLHGTEPEPVGNRQEHVQ